MVIDTSVLIAILLGEADRRMYLEMMAASPRLLLSAANLVEAGIVLMKYRPGDSQDRLDAFLQRAGIEVVPVDHAQALLAREAYRRFGKGRHPAQLNYGDCFAYALAVRTGDRLLFKGDDFSQTDVPGAKSIMPR